MPEKKTDKFDRGVKLAAGQSSPGSRVELFGHVTLVQAYNLSSYVGCHALIALRDTPGTTVAVLTSEPRLQSLPALTRPSRYKAIVDVARNARSTGTSCRRSAMSTICRKKRRHVRAAVGRWTASART